MCQCLCCGCWWCNICGVCCAGVHEAMCCCGCWVCKPDDLTQIDPDCCHMCQCVGSGGNFLCQGSVCCAPEYLKKWSVLRSTKQWSFIKSSYHSISYILKSVTAIHFSSFCCHQSKHVTNMCFLLDWRIFIKNTTLLFDLSSISSIRK